MITQRPFLGVVLFFGVLEVCAHDTTSERSIQDETLEGALHRTPQAHIVALPWYSVC
jgi:hypothetical protein